MSYIHYKYPMRYRFKTNEDMFDMLDWLWRNIGCSKRGNYEKWHMRKWMLIYYTEDDWAIEDSGKSVWVPEDNWTTRDCNFGNLLFYFKNAEDAMAFKLRWL